MKEIELTQEVVDSVFVEIKAEWDRAVSESGQTENMFLITDRSGYTANFMHKYASAKEYVESKGLVMPILIDGLSVEIGA